MANTLGSLVVNLGLNAAEFTSGLTKAEYDAQKLAKSLDRQFKSIATLIGSLGIGAAVGAFVRDTISAASALDDLADATGSSVEALSKLSNQAKISGTSFETLQGLVLKLSAGMAGADDESSNVGRALKFLGVSATDPAEALQQVAVSLNKYADGIGKAALARDLFGKNGPAFLATLKDIAESQDVAATTSAKQAAEAEKLEKALRSLSVEGTTFKNLVLNEIVPAVTRLIDEMKDGIKIFGSFGSALVNIGLGIDPFKKPLDSIKELNERINNIQTGQGLEARTLATVGRTNQTLEVLFKRRAYLLLQLGRQAAAEDFDDQVSRAAGRKPKADYTGAKDKEAKAGVDEFAKALERVNKMAAGAQVELDALASGEEEVSHAMKALAELMADDVWKKFTEQQQVQIRVAYDSVAQIEKEIDAIKKRREEYKKYIDDLQKQAEAEAKARERVRESVAAYAEQTEIIKRYTAIIGQDQLAHEKLAAAIEYENLVKKAKEANDLASIANLEKEYQARLKILEAQDAARKQNEEIQKSKQFVDDLARSFANAAEDAIVMGKSFKDVMKGLEQDILRIVTRRLVTEPLANMLSGFLGGMGAGNIGAGSAGAGSNFGSLLASLIGSFFGGGGQGYGTAGSNIPAGPYPYASGTDYARGGLSLVGERGPEVMYVPRGAQIIPNHELVRRREAGSRTVNQYINNLPGVTKQSANQAANEMLRRQMQAYNR